MIVVKLRVCRERSPPLVTGGVQARKKEGGPVASAGGEVSGSGNAGQWVQRGKPGKLRRGTDTFW